MREEVKGQEVKPRQGEEVTMSRLTRIGLSTVTIAIATLALSAGTALATSTPVWNITASASPTNFPLNAPGKLTESIIHRGNESEVLVRNLGDTPISGATLPIQVTMNLKLPPEVTVAGTEGMICGGRECNAPVEGMNCAGAICIANYDGTLPPGQMLSYSVAFNTGSSPGTGTNAATVSGGEAAGQPLAPAGVVQSLTVSSTPAPFELQPSSLLAEFVNPIGSPETQADSHPYNLSLYFAFTTMSRTGASGRLEDEAVEDVKEIAVELPPGVAGNELSLGQCEGAVLGEYKCPGSSQVGSIKVKISGGVGTPPWALFNLKPDNGHTNELGFDADEDFPVHMPTTVRTGGDYGLTSITPRVPNGLGAIIVVEAQVWGVPADSSHDSQRVLDGWDAEEFGGGKEPDEGGHESPLPPTPFLTMPSQCGKPLQFKIAVDSYGAPGRLNSSGEPDLSDPNWKVSTVTDPPLEGCEKLQTFTPHLTVSPDTTYADTPAGTTVEVSVPQGEGLTSPDALATPTLQNTSVTLPAGMTINPGQANGLGACQFSEDGITSEAEKAEGKENPGPASCPADSKVGTVEIETPLLPDKLQGNVYVMQSNPPDLQLLVAASADDVNLKLIGHVHLNEQTGQLTSTFDGTPALPFAHFRLIFSGGAQAALMTPPSCGVYASTSDFTPWSTPFTPDFLSSNGFALSAGPNGSGCSSPLPFSPSMIAGSTTDQAGGYTDFSLLLSRADGQQRIGSLQFKTPEGLLGMLSTVPLCPEPEAAAGTCSSASQIGHTVVGAGAGPDPLYIPEPGQAPAPIYLTGSYKGAPFGLSIVVPVIAGPFNLGTVVVRASISVDPITSQLTISTEPLPQILDGIPTDLRQINTVIDRPGFMFNPTSCAPMEFSGTAESAQGATAPISSHFQVGSCQSLTFKPDFKVSTSGKTSRANGASLDARIVYPTTPLGFNQASGQSNIKSVKVDLPKQLPSRLSTLQHACVAATFNANPANCPVASRIGSVKAVTPVLPVPLTGPVYFVSYGGAKWPELVSVLQGYGVRVDLHGETFIGEKSGITSSTFRQVPDVPIHSFELYLPQGPFSALAATGNLCKDTLKMPTAFTGQNGAVIHQSTPIAVSGCPKAVKATARRAGKKGKVRKG
jgi:hypothetical protein